VLQDRRPVRKERTMREQTVSTDTNGRDKQGRFTVGNRAATGQNYAGKIAELRSAMMKTITAKDMREVVEKLLSKAKAGDMRAIDLLLGRVFGAPVSADLLERIAELEARLNIPQEGQE